MYTLAKKHWTALATGTRLMIALPPAPCFVMNGPPSPIALMQWAGQQLCHLGANRITAAKLSHQWLNCSDPRGGLTGYFGHFIPDVKLHSNLSLPAIPTTVVIVEITPPHHVATDSRPKWPKSWTGQNGWVYEDDPIPDGRESRPAMNEAY